MTHFIDPAVNAASFRHWKPKWAGQHWQEPFWMGIEQNSFVPEVYVDPFQKEQFALVTL